MSPTSSIVCQTTLGVQSPQKYKVWTQTCVLALSLERFIASLVYVGQYSVCHCVFLSFLSDMISPKDLY